MDLELGLGAISDAALERVGAACHGGSIPRAVDELVVGDAIVGVAAGASAGVGTLMIGMKLLESHEGERSRDLRFKHGCIVYILSFGEKRI